MINGISIVSVWVLDQDSAKEFYTDKLGFTVTNDIQLEGGMRWLTVRPPSVPTGSRRSCGTTRATGTASLRRTT